MVLFLSAEERAGTALCYDGSFTLPPFQILVNWCYILSTSGKLGLIYKS